jgi:magnesium transporter
MHLSFYRKRHPPVGSSPGTLVLPREAEPLHVRVTCYAGTEYRVVPPDLEALDALLAPGTVTWVDVQGLGDERTLRQLAGTFNIHPLALEDVANAPQRPKAEEYDDHLFLVTRMARLEPGLGLDIEQIAIFAGSNYVVSFEEQRTGVLDPVRARLRDGKGLLRTAGPGYLAYAILDTIVDSYYPVIEQLSERLAALELRVLSTPTQATLDRMNRVKTDLVLLRRGIWPQLEAINRQLRDPSRFLTDQVRVYLRDTADHCAQLVDVVDSHRELVNGLLNTYLSLVGMRTNEVMKVLTIMTSIFIPLTFVAGIYGMNFEFMPELHSPWGYPILLAVMAIVAGAMLLFFRRRGWLGGGGGDEDDDDAPRAG